jgi:hypothetical protein
MLRVPVRVPAAVGEKVTSTVQLVPIPSVATQVPPDRVNSALVVTTMLLRLALGLARTVTVCVGLLLPTAVDGNVTVVGLFPR